jgi:hypothetical protein
MFNEKIREGALNFKEIENALIERYDVTISEFWTITSAILAYYFSLGLQKVSGWPFDENFFNNSPQKDGAARSLKKVLSAIARTPSELRDIYYADNSKYTSKNQPVGSWQTEFNILRDYPVIRVEGDKYCAPFPLFVFQRGSIGFYYDIIDEYAKHERAANPDNKNPNDNRATQCLGLFFQDYVGKQLAQIIDNPSELQAEFKYTVGKSEMDTPDWVLCRKDKPVVFIECKARRPSLTMQHRTTLDGIRCEIRTVIARAIRQFYKFIHNVERDGFNDLARYKGMTDLIYVLVLYDPFPWHATPFVRKMIDEISGELDVNQRFIRERLKFVPMSVRELEQGIVIDIDGKMPFEQQLLNYATYRNTAPFIDGQCISNHFEEFVQMNYNNSQFVNNPLCIRLWEQFMDDAFRFICNEGISEYLGG